MYLESTAAASFVAQ